MAIRAVAVGCGAYLPSRIVTNDELSKALDTSDEGIAQRTGIHQRHIAAKGEVTSDMGLAAARQALEMAGLDPGELDLIICATSTPDETFPATATRIQARLGCTSGAAFDVVEWVMTFYSFPSSGLGTHIPEAPLPAIQSVVRFG